VGEVTKSGEELISSVGRGGEFITYLEDGPLKGGKKLSNLRLLSVEEGMRTFIRKRMEGKD